MRTIKFRIWDTQEKKFYEPTHEAYNGKLDMLFVDLNGNLVRQTMTGLVHESMFPDRYIKQQLTGLKDKNEREIWEGDILSWSGWIGEVFWDNDFAAWRAKNIGSLGGIPNLEIIGNIWENHDLLSEVRKTCIECGSTHVASSDGQRCRSCADGL